MKKSKIFILLFTLSFPVILYLFLRFYGQNKFDLPVFFETEVKAYCDNTNINEESIKIYTQEGDSIQLLESYSADFKVVHIPNSDNKEIQTLKNELNRVLNTFEDLSIDIISLQPKSANDSLIAGESFLNRDKAHSFWFDNNKKNQIVNCVYAFPTEQWKGNHPSEEEFLIYNTLVLLDKENRIRGYYDGYETKEVDRLILEIRVLLSKD
jgi:protein SCO1/2